MVDAITLVDGRLQRVVRNLCKAVRMVIAFENMKGGPHHSLDPIKGGYKALSVFGSILRPGLAGWMIHI